MKKMKVSMLAAVLAAAAAVIFLVYGLVFTYFDLAVLACYLIAAVCFFLYAKKSSTLINILDLLGVFLMSFGLGLFFLNSYTVWADWYGHFDMYGSRGGIAPVIAQMVIVLAAIILGIISCFKAKED